MVKRSLIKNYMESIILAVLLAVILRSFVVSAFRIPTGSMFPTLQIGDFVFAYKLPYGIQLPFSDKRFFVSRGPDRGDVVVFRYPGDERISYIKRVIALAGDRVEIRNRELWLNEKKFEYKEGEFPGGDFEGKSYYRLVHESLDGSERSIMVSREVGKDSFGPTVVPAGQFFVLGDNRDSSDDSRYWGSIPLENLEGRVFLVWLSLDWNRKTTGGRFPTVRWNRIFSPVY